VSEAAYGPRTPTPNRTACWGAPRPSTLPLVSRGAPCGSSVCVASRRGKADQVRAVSEAAYGPRKATPIRTACWGAPRPSTLPLGVQQPQRPRRGGLVRAWPAARARSSLRWPAARARSSLRFTRVRHHQLHAKRRLPPTTLTLRVAPAVPDGGARATAGGSNGRFDSKTTKYK
jgi:hypothetical protein